MQSTLLQNQTRIWRKYKFDILIDDSRYVIKYNLHRIKKSYNKL